MNLYSILNFKFEILNSRLTRLGFTLVEIVVAIAILGTLAGGAFIALNPANQIDRAKDAISQQGLAEIRTALDSYYADHNCYPGGQSVFVTAINTGSEWNEAGVVYLSQAPLDGYGEPYIYVTDNNSSCSQWYTVFAKLSAAPENDACPLDEQSACVPVGFDDTWACATGGITNCAYLAGTQVNGNQIVYPTATPVPAGTITPTPTSFGFTISQPYGVYPRFYVGELSSIHPSAGQELDLRIDTDGESNPSPVTSVTATVTSDNEENTYQLYLSSGTAQNGGWSTSWIQSDTVDTTFVITLTFRDSAGRVASVDVSIR